MVIHTAVLILKGWVSCQLQPISGQSVLQADQSDDRKLTVHHSSRCCALQNFQWCIKRERDLSQNIESTGYCLILYTGWSDWSWFPDPDTDHPVDKILYTCFENCFNLDLVHKFTPSDRNGIKVLSKFLPRWDCITSCRTNHNRRISLLQVENFTYIFLSD